MCPERGDAYMNKWKGKVLTKHMYCDQECMQELHICLYMYAETHCYKMHIYIYIYKLYPSFILVLLYISLVFLLFFLFCTNIACMYGKIKAQFSAHHLQLMDNLANAIKSFPNLTNLMQDRTPPLTQSDDTIM